MVRTFRIRVSDNDPHTIEALIELIVKLWLISEDRTEDLLSYTYGDKRFEQEAREKGVFSIQEVTNG